MAEVTIDQAMQWAIQHYAAGHLPQAEQLCHLVLSGQPNHGEALNLLGVLASAAGRNDITLQRFESAAQLNPMSAEFQSNLGNALMANDQIEAAIVVYKRALQIDPDLAEVHNNLGAALARDAQPDAAIAEHSAAIRLQPGLIEAYSNRGNALVDQCRIEEAIACHRTALAIQPDRGEVHWNLATCLLLHGDFAEGWREFEWRPIAKLPQPMWDGSALGGRTILLRSEQGLGDTLQFIRYVKLVQEKDGRIIVECQPELIRELQQLACVSQWIERGQRLPQFDTWCPLLSLPFIFQTTLKDIPPPMLLKAKSGARGSITKVGLVWAGRSEHKNDRNRSIAFSMFEPLLKVPMVRVFSLQKGPAALRGAHANLIDLTANLNDFADTAALIDELDLVISVDTAVAHLAGTMGKPVWLLLPFSPDWRWMLNRNDSPWYPSMRLFRQTRAGDWRDVLQRVTAALTT